MGRDTTVQALLSSLGLAQQPQDNAAQRWGQASAPLLTGTIPSLVPSLVGVPSCTPNPTLFPTYLSRVRRGEGPARLGSQHSPPTLSTSAAKLVLSPWGLRFYLGVLASLVSCHRESKSGVSPLSKCNNTLSFCHPPPEEPPTSAFETQVCCESPASPPHPRLPQPSL